MFIVLTGASKGIGFEVAKQLAADEENTILAIARNRSDLNRLKELSPNKILIVNGDISQKSTLQKITTIVKQQGKRVDVLIHNAGSLINKPFPKISAKELQDVYQVNVFAPFMLTQHLLPFMGKKTRSHVVTISSMGGVQGSSKFPGLSAYSSSKAAIATLTEVLAEELKPLNISCNCLALGAVQTEMLSKAFPGYKAPLNAKQMAGFIVQFSLTGHSYFNGKILPVSLSTP
jgi:3-oxoacyl-[acyl-carrier protein] reductase